jgi:LPPG:FO 2-phospho-L-lactate transferase
MDRVTATVNDNPATVLALSGGIGGAKLVTGLARVLAPQQLLVMANTGDDFEHLGLTICPDLDTLMYTLAGVHDPAKGWGRAGDTRAFMHALAELGGDTWFQLGDADLATHVERTRRLKSGETLSAVTADFCRRLGVATRLLPMSDQPVRTLVQTADAVLPFQQYFVAQHCAPEVRGFSFQGAASARPLPPIMDALASHTLRAVVICPSNPFISIDPILALPGVRAALAACAAPVIAVSPIVGGRALKGPTAKMMRELDLPVTATSVARRYRALLDGYVLDRQDAAQVQDIGIPVCVSQTVMRNLDDKQALAYSVLAFADELARQPLRHARVMHAPVPVEECP